MERGSNHGAQDRPSKQPKPNRTGWFSSRVNLRREKQAEGGGDVDDDDVNDGNNGAAASTRRRRGAPSRWSMGVLNDAETIEVPGSVLLLALDHNQPLGLRNAPARRSHSSIATGYSADFYRRQQEEDEVVAEEAAEREREGEGKGEGKKRTPDGRIILDPQPEESANDPLNWPALRRDVALLSLGLYCMVGGGLTPLLAAGFTDVASDYDVDVSSVSLTTGLYMLGMGLGSVIFSPTAILWGKRPVYLFSAVIVILASAWCALSPNFASLIVARVFQGIAISPVECLPSATIAEIFFLHERAFRIGIYTLLLLGGKNLVPLVSAAIMQRLGWRWAFWIVAMVTGFCGFLLFLFVPETFWDRAPIPRSSRKPGTGNERPNHFFRRFSSKQQHDVPRHGGEQSQATATATATTATTATTTKNQEEAPRPARAAHVGFAPAPDTATPRHSIVVVDDDHDDAHHPVHNNAASQSQEENPTISSGVEKGSDIGSGDGSGGGTYDGAPLGRAYTHTLRDQPALSFTQQLKPFHGRLNQDKWLKAACRPLILFSYPAVLWSSAVYACSVGWLIVISESVAVIYRSGVNGGYGFTALQAGLVYISPFVGGVLGTAVAGRVSDIVVRAMASRNGGLYEPEFRLVMAAPIAITTVMGLMGFGWSAEVHDNWIVPTVFFGIVSFGCSLGSTTAITFCVDSYRQYAGEALVTLNFSKNVLHGLVFSLFVTGWIEHDGPKSVYIWIGVIQLILLSASVPMYIYGKRARMWTVRKNFMEKF